MKTAVLCFGNKFIEMDSLPLILYKKLKNKIPSVEFVHCESPNEIMDYADYDNVFILDTVKGIRDVSIICDLDLLKERKIFTSHDFDLGFFLKVLNSIKKMKNIKIIGIPTSYKEDEAEKKVKKILTSI
jgi:Ni,Fe-hydrogenase maturation factor